MTPDPTDGRGLTRRRLLKTAVRTALAGGMAIALPDAEAALSKRSTMPTMPSIPADIIAPVVPPKVLPFDLADVRLLPGPFQHAQQKDGAYLLFLEPDRHLHNFHVNAGLPPKAPLYGGWESRGIAGHTLGHYLSACAMMYRATGDARFRQKADYCVTELALCQQQSSDGLVTAIPDARAIFTQVAADGTMTGWVPWYTMHKLFAGLRDTYRYCGNEQARDVLITLSDWAIGVTHTLSDAQFQGMLATEHGGMAETLADVYALTGDGKYLALARRFTHRAVFDPLAARQDRLDGLHSNTQIPKLIGSQRIYELTGEKAYGEAALFFWQTVTQNRTFANGGNGDYEHFFPVADFANHVHSDNAAETCSTHNMLKLTRAHFAQQPSAAYADYYERGLYNDILASQAPDSGMMMYFAPMKPGHFKVYNDPTEAFWCCVGTGMENHAKYGDSIYFHSADATTLYVNLFIPSTLHWKQKGVQVRQETTFPESDTTHLTLTCEKPTAFALKIRRPFWTDGMTISVNDKPVSAAAGADGYVHLQRTWRTGDTVAVKMPMCVRLEPLPHAPAKQAVMFGPVLLVGAMGQGGMDTLPDITTNEAPYTNLPAVTPSVFVTNEGSAAGHIHPVPGQPLSFHTQGLGQPDDVSLVPYYQLHHQRYNTYWSVFSPTEWQQHKAELAAEAAQQAALDARTVDRFLPGDQQSEVEHHLTEHNSHKGSAHGRLWRDASGGGSFAFTLKSDPAARQELLCTYWGSDAGGRVFDIVMDGMVLAKQTLDNNLPGQYFDVTYAVPVSAMAGKTSITVTLRAKPGGWAGGLFDCRLLRVPGDAGAI